MSTPHAPRRSVLRLLAPLTLILLGGCASTRAKIKDALSDARTRAERTGWRETSTHADVLAFLDSVAVTVDADRHAGPLAGRARAAARHRVAAADPHAAGGAREWAPDRVGAGEHPRRRSRRQGGAAGRVARPPALVAQQRARLDRAARRA